ncbi:MAG: hypothetical protein KBT07_09175 [Clostridiales bacterium]|nr:hypothetical protein [Candidatus Scatonaster coprocaballi]
MENKDMGWSFLNFSGSGSYHGADGSWGYRSSDGSGSYHGADGSWGYTSSDGSGSYHGADGSWGYKDSDGHSSYFGADGSYRDLSSSNNELSSSSSESSTDLADGLFGLALVLGAWGLVKLFEKTEGIRGEIAEQQRENERIEMEKRAEEERVRQAKIAERKHQHYVWKKRAKALITNGSKVKTEFSTNDLLGKKLDYVLSALYDTGFCRCKAIPIRDICSSSIAYEGQVQQVVIGQQSWIDTGSEIPFNTEVIVTYHAKIEYAFPYSSREVSKMKCTDLSQKLAFSGFTNVQTRPIEDLLLGWLSKEDKVIRVTVREGQVVSKGELLEFDTPILIEHHSYIHGT